LIYSNNATYGSVAKFFHWTYFLMLTGVYILAYTHVIKWHIPLAILTTGMLVSRLSWRVFDKKPEPPLTIPHYQSVLAQLTHKFLYLAVLIMPISGVLMSNSGGYKVSFLDWFTFPMLIEKNMELKPLFKTFHIYFGYTVLGIIGLHILAAFYHHFFRKDNVLKRMLPSCK
jgi:superoxide oxidase